MTSKPLHYKKTTLCQASDFTAIGRRVSEEQTVHVFYTVTHVTKSLHNVAFKIFYTRVFTIVGYLKQLSTVEGICTGGMVFIHHTLWRSGNRRGRNLNVRCEPLRERKTQQR